jgi:hypothetical protein
MNYFCGKRTLCCGALLSSALTLGLIANCGDSEEVADQCQDFDTTQVAAPKAYKEEGENNWVETTYDFESCTEAVASNEICPFEGQVIDFQEDEWLDTGVLGGTTVKLFPANKIEDIDATCVSYDSTDADVICYEAVASETGRVDFPNVKCNTPFALWANKIATFAPPTKPAVEFDRVVRPTSTGLQDVMTISTKTYNLVPGIVGFSPDATLGLVAGKAQDCAAVGVAGIAAHIASEHLTVAPASFCGAESIHRVGTFYFKDNFPANGETDTSEDGLWALANVPVGNATVFGFSNTQGTKTQVGYTQGVSLADTITIVDLVVTIGD